jgi:hypothetical protein
MTISTADQLINAMGNNSSRITIDKSALGSSVAGEWFSLWRATGQPGQGLVPTTAAMCNHTTLGGMSFTQQTSPATSYLALLEGLNSNASTTLEIHDRIAHMGGLSGIVTTAQTVNLDLNAFSTDNIAARIGDSNYSDVTWWLEWYTDTGATGANCTINVTFNDGTSNNLTTFTFGRRLGRAIPLNGLIQAADSGKYIRDINTVTLSASTGTAGNFGFTATRYRAALYIPLQNARFEDDWADLGLPEIPNSSCLTPMVICGSTTTGSLRATGKVIHG